MSAVLAVIGGLVLYFTFLKKSNEGKFKKFLNWMYNFLSFRKLLLEDLLKICYIILALFVTLGSFSFISQGFVYFICVLILGNLALRVTFEFSLMMVLICKNTSEINSKLSSKNVDSTPKKENTNKKEEVNAQ